MSAAAPTPLRAGMEARDHDAVVGALAPDVVVISPIIGVPFRGIEEASDLFAVVIDTFEELTYEAEIPGDPHVLVFHAIVRGEELQGVDLLRFDEQGRIREMTILLRPFRGIAAFLKATGPKLARRRGGGAQAAALAMATPPLVGLMKATNATAPRLLKLQGARRR
jgi:SnoaL-like domain